MRRGPSREINTNCAAMRWHSLRTSCSESKCSAFHGTAAERRARRQRRAMASAMPSGPTARKSAASIRVRMPSNCDRRIAAACCQSALAVVAFSGAKTATAIACTLRRDVGGKTSHTPAIVSISTSRSRVAESRSAVPRTSSCTARTSTASTAPLQRLAPERNRLSARRISCTARRRRGCSQLASPSHSRSATSISANNAARNASPNSPAG